MSIKQAIEAIDGGYQMRELLKEARDWIFDADVSHKGMKIQREILLRCIDAALSTSPSDSAMELVAKIRQVHTVQAFDIPDTEAAALIDEARAVPRAMLKNIEIEYMICGQEKYDSATFIARLISIFAKYGVKLEV